MSKQALENQVKDLKDKIRDLEKTAEFKEKELDLEKQQWDIDCRSKMLIVQKETMEREKDLKIDVQSYKVKAEEANKRFDEGAYKKLSDILQALTVKLPTLDIKEISIHSKSKK